MANSWFQFKQFTIQQDKCAMKVTTDGCLFGALVANEISTIVSPKVLDIGTGTGLLSLMIAQENTSARIDAIEIDAAAALQASENAAASPWGNRIAVLQGDILHYQTAKQYDVIISNPPFYEHQLFSPKAGRQVAHHSSGLTLLPLFQQVKKLLREEGKFYLLLPYYRFTEALSIAKESNLFPESQWLIKQTPKHDWFRIVMSFSSKNAPLQKQVEITIRNVENEYIPAFNTLLQPFYLKL